MLNLTLNRHPHACTLTPTCILLLALTRSSLTSGWLSSSRRLAQQAARTTRKPLARQVHPPAPFASPASPRLARPSPAPPRPASPRHVQPCPARPCPRPSSSYTSPLLLRVDSLHGPGGKQDELGCSNLIPYMVVVSPHAWLLYYTPLARAAHAHAHAHVPYLSCTCTCTCTCACYMYSAQHGRRRWGGC